MFAKLALLVLVLLVVVVMVKTEKCCDDNALEPRSDLWDEPLDWSLDTRIPMTSEFDISRRGKGKFKVKKKFKRFLLPLLLAYKLKFFTLIPVMIGGLILLTGATGLAGFFFALFAAVMGLKNTGH